MYKNISNLTKMGLSCGLIILLLRPQVISSGQVTIVLPVNCERELFFSFRTQVLNEVQIA